MDTEIRKIQEKAVERIEAALLRGDEKILFGVQFVSREAAWAATQSIRSCWKRGLQYYGQKKNPDGSWRSLGVQVRENGKEGFVLSENIGFFPTDEP